MSVMTPITRRLPAVSRETIYAILGAVVVCGILFAVYENQRSHRIKLQPGMKLVRKGNIFSLKPVPWWAGKQPVPKPAEPFRPAAAPAARQPTKVDRDSDLEKVVDRFLDTISTTQEPSVTNEMPTTEEEEEVAVNWGRGRGRSEESEEDDDRNYENRRKSTTPMPGSTETSAALSTERLDGGTTKDTGEDYEDDDVNKNDHEVKGIAKRVDDGEGRRAMPAEVHDSPEDNRIDNPLFKPGQRPGGDVQAGLVRPGMENNPAKIPEVQHPQVAVYDAMKHQENPNPVQLGDRAKLAYQSNVPLVEKQGHQEIHNEQYKSLVGQQQDQLHKQLIQVAANKGLLTDEQRQKLGLPVRPVQPQVPGDKMQVQLGVPESQPVHQAQVQALNNQVPVQQLANDVGKEVMGQRPPDGMAPEDVQNQFRENLQKRKEEFMQNYNIEKALQPQLQRPRQV